MKRSLKKKKKDKPKRPTCLKTQRARAAAAAATSDSAGTGNVLPSCMYEIAEELQGNCSWLTATEVAQRPSGEHAVPAGSYLAPIQSLKESSAYVLQDCVPRGESWLAADLRNCFIKTFSHHFCLKLLAISSPEFPYDAGLPRQITIGLCMHDLFSASFICAPGKW